MTIFEAEKQFRCEVENHYKLTAQRAKKAMMIWSMIGVILIMIGIILAVIGFATPPEIDSLGFEWTSTAALFEKVFGIGMICLGAFFTLFMNIMGHRAIKKGPQNFLPQIKNLYLNYLQCEDISNSDKEFFKQKLENIRTMELVNAINKASANASAAIMYSMLHK